MKGVIRYGPDDKPPQRKTTVILSKSELRVRDNQGVIITGRDTKQELIQKLIEKERIHRKLAEVKKKLSAVFHAVQGGLPGLGKRR